jgi:hypothetical protein
MRKIYISPTYGRSHDIPSNLTHLFSSEETTYRMTVTKSQLEMKDHPDIPVGLCESYETGNEKVEEIITTIFGENETYVSWDATGFRYYVEFEDLEETLEDICFSTGLRVTLDRRDRENQFKQELLEAIYGFPEINEDDWTCELETEIPRLAATEDEEEIENWK